MSIRITLGFLALLLFFSCQKDEYPSLETHDIQAVKPALGKVHSTILKSAWWKAQPEAEKEILAIEMAHPIHPISYQQLEKKFLNARRAAMQDLYRAKVCPGFPSDDPVINPNGDVDLYTQADVDAFGALKCKEILGSLRIIDTLGVDPICDLTPLKKIKSVGSSLNVSGGPCLSSLDGLQKLKSVGQIGPFGFVAVQGPVLNDIEAFSNLRSITGSINVINSPALISVTNAFERITSIDSSFVPVASFISNYVLNINGNPALADISGFRNLANIDRNLLITNNGSLANLDDLSALSGNLEFLFIDGNATLQDIDGLSGITSITESIFIDSNPALQNLDGLSGISSVGNIVLVTNNPVIGDCCGLYNMLCNEPPACSVSGIGGGLFSDVCDEIGIISGGPCL